MIRLQVGDSCEVMEWRGSGKYCKEHIGFQSVSFDLNEHGECFLFSKDSRYILSSRNEIKPIGKLTITKVKLPLI